MARNPTPVPSVCRQASARSGWTTAPIANAAARRGQFGLAAAETASPAVRRATIAKPATVATAIAAGIAYLRMAVPRGIPLHIDAGGRGPYPRPRGLRDQVRATVARASAGSIQPAAAASASGSADLTTTSTSATPSAKLG